MDTRRYGSNELPTQNRDSESCSFTGSSADNIVSHFAVNYHNEAQALGIDLNELYAALKADGEDGPPEWDIEGRQINVYKYSQLILKPQYLLMKALGSTDMYHSQF